ncbi:Hypothetical predicted protein [Pelobates cultripes]|uniref:L1 transposable element RRM domain-containing protein n=1 Tax=Pelobates cultripes TaxID=61616 RepID=A0AAD1RY87_PELCU|nr:Hypothetical predicted protein [Pelobates cultripes]
MESFPSTPARLSPTPSFSSEPQLTQEGEWRAILPNLLTKADFEALSDRLGRVVREEVAQLRADLANVEARMSVAESETRALRTDLEHTNSTVTSQEADLASLTTWVDDLDNRGRRLNLRVRGVREGDPAEHIPDTLKRLFAQILGGPANTQTWHKNYQLKEDILRTARRMGTIRFENQTISIYQDLSRYTLQARRALRPVTSTLQQAGIPYRWGYPFSLSARHGQVQHMVKKPSDLPGFLRAMGIPPIKVPDWLASSFLQPPPGPQQPRRPDQGPPRLQQQRRRDWNPGPARQEQEN